MAKDNVLSITIATGAVNADAAFDLPAGVPEVGKILEAAIILPDKDTGVITNTALTPVIDAADIAADTISVVDGNSLRCGTALTTLMLVRVTYRVK